MNVDLLTTRGLFLVKLLPVMHNHFIIFFSLQASDWPLCPHPPAAKKRRRHLMVWSATGNPSDNLDTWLRVLHVHFYHSFLLRRAEVDGCSLYSQSCEERWRKVKRRWLRFTSSMGMAT